MTGGEQHLWSSFAGVLKRVLIEEQVGLAAAVVVGITCGHTVARRELVGVGPAGEVVEVAGLTVDVDELAKPLEIYAAGPQVARTLFLYERGLAWVAVFLHEIVVGKMHGRQHVGLFRQAGKTQC